VEWARKCSGELKIRFASQNNPASPSSSDMGGTLTTPAAGPHQPFPSHRCRRPLPRWRRASSPKGGGGLRSRRCDGAPGAGAAAPGRRRRRSVWRFLSGGARRGRWRWRTARRRRGAVRAWREGVAGRGGCSGRLGPIWAPRAARRVAAGLPRPPRACWWGLTGLLAAVALGSLSGGSGQQ
jgi:hypothetical protein